MRRRTFHACLLGGLGFSLAPLVAGCTKSDTILLIEIYGPFALEPWQFLATITAGNDAKSFYIPPERHPSPLPQSFSVALDRSHTGPMTVTIQAYDERFIEIANGTTVQQHIVIGGQTVIAVELTESGVPGLPDAGAGDGAAGQDAADAGADTAGDGMGLEDATD
jgi:hypothetical protein